MKINSVNSIDNKNLKADKNQSNPNFKGLVDLPGMAMNAIEKGGFATSFLIQDTMGMTAPRTGEGLIRGVDKERVNATWNVIKARLTFREPKPEDKAKALKLKDLNFKEGFEVAIREGLSGPLMMATPAIMLLLGRKYVGKSTFTNSSMISRLGKKLTNIVKDGSHETMSALKKDFYRTNITDIVKATTKATDAAAESKFIDAAVESVEKLDRLSARIAQTKGKYRKSLKKLEQRETKKLMEMFNDFHKTNSSDLGMVNRVKFDGEVYSTDKMISGMRAYAEDAFKGKQIADVTEQYAKNQMNSSIAKRVATNIASVGATIGALSVVPKLYKLVNPVPPGALGDPNQTVAPAKAEVNNQTQQTSKQGQVSFTGRWDKIARNLEFNGNQFTPALMTALAVGGLMGPRVAVAAKRAPEDPKTKKKDYSEIPEILTRDITSTAAVTFGVPMLSKALINTYEHGSGFVLQNRPEKPMSKVRKFFDMLNPFSSYSYYGISDLDQIYGNINTPEKLNNMTKFVDKNEGSLAKVFNTVDKSKEVFEEFGLNIKELAEQTDRKAANKVIMDKMASSKEFTEKMLEAVKPAKEGAANNILKRARSLNSFVSAAATFLLVPAFLGIVLPKVVYGMTARRQKKNAEANGVQQASAQPTQAVDTKKAVIDYSKLRTPENVTFKQMKHS